MGIFNEFFKKEKPVFTGLKFGFGSGGGGATGPSVFSASGGAKIETGGYVYHLFYDGLSGSDNFEVASVRPLSLMFVSLVVVVEVVEKQYWFLIITLVVVEVLVVIARGLHL